MELCIGDFTRLARKEGHDALAAVEVLRNGVCFPLCCLVGPDFGLLALTRFDVADGVVTKIE